MRELITNRWNESIICDTPQSNGILEISGAGVTNPNPQYKILHNIRKSELDYDYYNFEYVISGMGYVETPEKTYAVRAGDFFFLNKLRYHVYYSDLQDPFKKAFIVVRGALADKLVELYKISESVIIRRLNMFPLFEQIFSNLLNCEHYPNSELERQVFNLFQSIYDIDKIKTESPYDIAEQIEKYLLLNVQKNISIEKIAKDLHISASGVNHLFAKRYNCSVMQYFIKKKVSYAKALLRTTDDSIKDIAKYLAFNDEKYFSRCFKKHTNCTPSEYRKKHKA